MASNRSSSLARLGWVGLLVLALMFAVQGGEFSSSDLLRQRREKARIAHAIDSLKRLVDSLGRYRDAVERDPATQERLARELFGMVRGDKELLYRFADSSSIRQRP